MPQNEFPSAGILRRIAAAFYDLLLVLALLIIATALLLPLTHGQAINSADPLAHTFYQLYLLTLVFVFNGWFWTHGGQTLGMRVWRLRLVDESGGTISWRQALIRFACAIPAWLLCMLGIFWIRFSTNRLAWQDRASGTRVILTPPLK